MNFYGLETPRKAFVCDWAHPPEWYLERLKKNMFIDTIRVPFSYQYLLGGDLSYLDHFIDQCSRLDLSVILDYHRTWDDHQGPYPEENISRDQFINSWIWLLDRYKDVYNVFGVGIFNEIQLPNDFDYANNLHREVISTIENKFPERFIYFAGCPGWGGNCSLMNLQDMPTWNRTYIEVHKYIFSGNSVESDWDISIPNSINSDRWFVGETGWKQGIDQEREWAETFLSYLKMRNISNVCAWTIAHSGDTEGWWKDDCETFDWEKAALFNTLFFGSFKRLRGPLSLTKFLK